MFKQIVSNLVGNTLEKRKIRPQDEKTAILMLMRAIYVEVNFDTLELIEKGYAKQLKTKPNIHEWSKAEYEELKEDVIEAFCLLNDGVYGKEHVEDAQDLLEESWDIVDRQDAISELEWLRDCGSRNYFQTVREYENEFKDFSNTSLKAFIEKCRSKNITIPHIDFDEDDEENDLTEFEAELKKEISYIKDIEQDLPACGILAWDMTRYIDIICNSFIGNYMTCEECWAEIEKVKSLCFENFQDWRSFSKSFFIGSTFDDLDYEDEDEDTFKVAAEQLLAKSISPWTLFLWTDKR